MKFLLPLLAAAAGAALAAPFVPRSTQFTAEAAKDGWIVVMKDDAPHDAFLRTRDLAMAAGAAPRHTFDFGRGLLRGHVMRGPGSEIAVQSLAGSEHIAFIQPDTPFTLDDFVSHNETAPDYHDDTKLHSSNDGDGSVSEPTDQWGLHRISHGPIRHSQPLEYRRNSTGRTSTVYVLDTGISLDHREFGGRAKWGRTFLRDGDESWMPPGGDDNGHGTHCAGTIGGATLGVAREANLVAVKVVNNRGSGYPSNIIRGLQWVINDATANDRLEKSVISMSIGSRVPPEFYYTGRPDANMIASRIAATKGMFVVAAAGNERAPVGSTSPAAEGEVCTIGAIDRNDKVGDFSNYGAGVDLFAPGVDILSAWPGNKTMLLDGTSMACPHLSGLGAYMMDLDGPGRSTPGRQMCERLRGMATYRSGSEEREPPRKDYEDVKNKYTKVANNGWQS
ncbi:Secreted subtilisin-like serine protease sub5 [Apiospora rasikravindrae]|uniref:Secreted subtilisin-like serine protease sub5 n=1 Tax=Apiospora rasikravindrae TaxID=990691 RepID=A0ABR1SWC2_9PEZI